MEVGQLAPGGVGVGAVSLGLSVSLVWEGAEGISLAGQGHVVSARRVPG